MIEALGKPLGRLGMLLVYRRLPSWVERTGRVPALNFGYAGDAPPGSSDAERWNQMQLSLYRLVASPLFTRDGPLDVVEVGSGLGVGASWLATALGGRVRSFRAIDQSANAIAFCRRTYKHPALSFASGDAMQVPLPDATADAVINVESSHMYRDMDAFLAEVHRVLKPGGLFLWADLRRPDRMDATLKAIAAKFRVLESQDITSGVVASLTQDEARKERYLADILRAMNIAERQVAQLTRPHLRSFMGMNGTPISRAFQAREMLYHRVVGAKIEKTPHIAATKT